MRCLYCGEPLSLLRKLTGKAEFCSDAHKEAYQQEFNSLALQRLAAQPKQSRRVEVPPASLPSLAGSYPGLPLPEVVLNLPDDEEELELPVFDSPIFTGAPSQRFSLPGGSCLAQEWHSVPAPQPQLLHERLHWQDLIIMGHCSQGHFQGGG